MINSIVTLLIILLIGLIYKKKIKKEGIYSKSKFVLLVDLIVSFSENTVFEILGSKFKHFTTYFLYLLSYITISSWLSVFGLESPFVNYFITFCLALMTFFGIYFLSLKYQKILFFKKFLVNPLNIFTQFTPLISLSLRLFINMIIGWLLISFMSEFLDKQIMDFSPFNFFKSLFLFTPLLVFIRFFFDIFDGMLQAFVFAILTIIYWQLAIGSN
jgi:F-type H+-transporting ATPase subunit a